MEELRFKVLQIERENYTEIIEVGAIVRVKCCECEKKNEYLYLFKDKEELRELLKGANYIPEDILKIGGL